MTARRQPGFQLAVVVDLAVADRHHAALVVDQRLPAVGDAADGQPGGPQHRGVAGVQARVIRAAVGEGAQHRLDPGGGAGSQRCGAEADVAADAAHD